MTEWNNDRLDELNGRVKDGFAQVDQDMKNGFARVDREMKEGFARVDQEMKEGFSRVDQEMKDGFARVDQDMKNGFARVDQEMKGRFAEVNKRFEKTSTKEEMAEVRSQLLQLNGRFDRFLSILVAACLGMVGSIFIAVLGFLLQS